MNADRADIVLEFFEGMTLRDYFASAAMAATLNGFATGLFLRADMETLDDGELMPKWLRKGVASISYAYADALIAERAKATP